MTLELEVIAGDGEDDERGPVTVRRLDGHCRHRQTELDTDARRVYCAGCKAEVDAFEVLLMLAREPARWRDAIAGAKREAKRKREELEDLKRQVRNARAQLRRATR